MLSFLFRLLLLPVLVGLLSSCSSGGGYFSDQERAYRSQREVVDDLEIPPDLSSSSINDAMVIPAGSSASYSEYQTNRKGDGQQPRPALSGSQVLPEFAGMEVRRDGDQRWLVIDAPPDDVWFKVVEFWRSNGLLLVEQDPTIGVMTTDWLESRADIKQGAVTEFLRKALDSIYSSATRDQFRVRLEQGEMAGVTELYLTHRGMVEKLVQNTGGDSDTTYWTPSPNEPEIEAAMLRSLMVYLGASGEQADKSLAKTETKVQRARLIKTDQTLEMMIEEPFSRAWRLTGVALDRIGFAVEDRNRSEGIYFVRYKALADDDKKGFFSKLAFWRDDAEIDDQNQYQVKLDGLEQQTRVTVNNQEGERQNSTTAARILSLLEEQIR